ncbi:MAG: hypothetical protein NNA18_08515 [Nitrospira sp.]|nr:hypothetical protein [Nitrospira sp.]
MLTIPFRDALLTESAVGILSWRAQRLLTMLINTTVSCNIKRLPLWQSAEPLGLAFNNFVDMFYRQYGKSMSGEGYEREMIRGNEEVHSELPVLIGVHVLV